MGSFWDPRDLPAMHIFPSNMEEETAQRDGEKYQLGKTAIAVPSVWLLQCPTVTQQAGGGGVGGISQNRNMSFTKVPKQPKLVAEREVAGLKSRHPLHPWRPRWSGIRHKLGCQ